MQEGQGAESWEGDPDPRPDTDMSHGHSTPPGPVLEKDLGQNQSAEQDKYPGATNLASGMSISWTSDGFCAVLSSKDGLRMQKRSGTLSIYVI